MFPLTLYLLQTRYALCDPHGRVSATGVLRLHPSDAGGARARDAAELLALLRRAGAGVGTAAARGSGDRGGSGGGAAVPCSVSIGDGTGSLPVQHAVAAAIATMRGLAAPGGGSASASATGGGGGDHAAANANVSYAVVSEAGASIYSVSDAAREELPQYDATIRGAVSIARRLQDPLSELVKIDPKAVGVGQYQHDVPPKLLERRVGDVVLDCVSAVGVDVNVASPHLLRHVPGLDKARARALFEFVRAAGRGGVRSLAALRGVKGIGPKSWEQAAAFLRVLPLRTTGELPAMGEPLDATSVHPESYAAARELLARAGLSASGLAHVVASRLSSPAAATDATATAAAAAAAAAAATAAASWRQRLEALRPSLPSLSAQLGIGALTLADVLDALQAPARDIRDDAPPPLMRTTQLSLADAMPGMSLEGTVRNVVDFGAFVDVGLKDEGLLHRSEMGQRGGSGGGGSAPQVTALAARGAQLQQSLPAQDAAAMLAVGDVVRVRVLSVDMVRKRLALTLDTGATAASTAATGSGAAVGRKRGRDEGGRTSSGGGGGGGGGSGSGSGGSSQSQQSCKSQNGRPGPPHTGPSRTFTFGEQQPERKRAKSTKVAGGGRDGGGGGGDSGGGSSNSSSSSSSGSSGSKAPRARAATSGNSNSWKCRACTLLNKPHHLACDACANPRD